MSFVYCAGNLPVITENPVSTFVELKDNITNVFFTCKAEGAQSYYWQKQHGEIPSNTKGINTSNLTIVNVQLNHAGNYRCVAINGSGNTSSKYATLSFKGMYVVIYVCMHVCMYMYTGSK